MKKLIIFIAVIIFAKNFSFCQSCHNGRKEVNLDSLKKETIIKKLKNFQKSKKGTMYFISKKLTNKDIEEIAKTYGK